MENPTSNIRISVAEVHQPTRHTSPCMCSVILMEAGQHKQLATVTITAVWSTHVPSQIPDHEDILGQFDSLSSPSLAAI